MATVNQALVYNMPKELWGAIPITPAPVNKDNFHLTGADASWTVPSGASYVIVTTTANVWWRIGGVAAVPVANTTDGSGAGLFAAGSTRGITILAGQVLHLFGTADGVLEWFSAGNPLAS